MVLWPARYEHKSGAQASRYANTGQDCGSTKYGTIRKASLDLNIIMMMLRLIEKIRFD